MRECADCKCFYSPPSFPFLSFSLSPTSIRVRRASPPLRRPPIGKAKGEKKTVVVNGLDHDLGRKGKGGGPSSSSDPKTD